MSVKQYDVDATTAEDPTLYPGQEEVPHDSLNSLMEAVKEQNLADSIEAFNSGLKCFYGEVRTSLAEYSDAEIIAEYNKRVPF